MPQVRQGDADVSMLVSDPEMRYSEEDKSLLLRFQIFEQDPGAEPKESGKHLQLSLTPIDGAKLFAALEALRARHELLRASKR